MAFPMLLHEGVLLRPCHRSCVPTGSCRQRVLLVDIKVLLKDWPKHDLEIVILLTEACIGGVSFDLLTRLYRLALTLPLSHLDITAWPT